jgi:hypothetical protein
LAVGDEVGLTEDLYCNLIGRYVSTIEVLSKRSVLKDQHIARLETQLALLEAAQGKDLNPGDVVYLADGDEPPEDVKK